MRINKIDTFRAFRNRNYALFFTGQSISQIGTWMQRTAISWVIYSLTHSPFMLGLSVFTAQFPSFLFSLYGGIIADRYQRYRILLITQSASLLQALVLAILVLSGHSRLWEIFALNVILGTINAFDVPARQPLVHELIKDKSELPNAMALNSSMVNIARLIGPAFSGIILQKFGSGVCFLLNALSFLAVLGSLTLLKLPIHVKPPEKKKAILEFRDGFRYLKNTPSISMLILMLGLLCFLVMPYDTLLPVFAKTIFKGNALTFGYIYSFIGMGAIAGTIFLASIKPGINLRKVLLINTSLLGIALIGFSHLTHFPNAMPFAVLAGFGTMSLSTIFITIVQVRSAHNMRGRMISYVAMAMFGMLPLGGLMVGTISQKIGAPDTILIQGCIAILIALVFSKTLINDHREEQLSVQKQPDMTAEALTRGLEETETVIR
jgi:MFS family permease